MCPNTSECLETAHLVSPRKIACYQPEYSGYPNSYSTISSEARDWDQVWCPGKSQACIYIYVPLRVYNCNTFFFFKIILTAQIFFLYKPALHSSGTLANLLSS